MKLSAIFIYKFCRQENLIQPPGEPQELNLYYLIVLFFWLLSYKISQFETLKLLEVLDFFYFCTIHRWTTPPLLFDILWIISFCNTNIIFRADLSINIILLNSIFTILFAYFCCTLLIIQFFYFRLQIKGTNNKVYMVKNDTEVLDIINLKESIIIYNSLMKKLNNYIFQLYRLFLTPFT